VAGDGGGADVEPIDRLRREFLRWAGLDGVNPTWWYCVSVFAATSFGIDRLETKLELTMERRTIPGIGSFP